MRPICCDVVLLMLTTASCFRTRGVDIRRSFHVKRSDNVEVIPAPIVVPPSQYFDGIDGSWSTFNIRVGTPAQSVRVIASTNSPQTLVVRPQGCLIGAIPAGVPNNCVSTRGGTFDSDRSRSWVDQGWFGLNGGQVGYEANLGYNFNLDYGQDILGLGFKEGDAPTLKNQTVSAYNLPNPLYLGQFGLGTQPVIFSTFGNYSVPSFFVTLRNQRLIPSLSWSYTAGASYRLSAGQYAQLIFGGYDTSRFQSNDVQFFLSGDVTRDIVVGLQSILYTGTTSSALLSEPIYAFIESTDPNIWLPLSACLQFEQVFGLTYDNATQKYLMNTTQYTAISAANPSVTFRLASSTTGGAAVDIALPFGAFGLKASYPFVPNSTYYFPLKRAANETQYTLGRVFLQEAYLTVDYDRGNFSVSQCTWQQSATSRIQSILAPATNGTSSANATNHSSDTKSKKNSNTPAIAGSVATVAVVAIIGALGFWYWRRRKQQKKQVSAEPSEGNATQLPLTDYNKNQNPQVIEPEKDGTGSMFGYYRKDGPQPGSLHSYYKPGNESTTSRGELADSSNEIHEVAAEERPSEIGDSESRLRYELETPMPIEMEGNNEWGRPEMSSAFVQQGVAGRQQGHASIVGSEASAVGLLGSLAAWHSVSSRVSWRSISVSRESSVGKTKEERPG